MSGGATDIVINPEKEKETENVRVHGELRLDHSGPSLHFARNGSIALICLQTILITAKLTRQPECLLSLPIWRRSYRRAPSGSEWTICTQFYKRWPPSALSLHTEEVSLVEVFKPGPALLSPPAHAVSIRTSWLGLWGC